MKYWATLDEGCDYFNVSFERDENITERTTIEDAVFDEPANVIDRNAEYTGADYEARVKREWTKL